MPETLRALRAKDASVNVMRRLLDRIGDCPVSDEFEILRLSALLRYELNRLTKLQPNKK